MITNFSSYSVSQDGSTVTNLRTGRLLKQRTNEKGYKEVTLRSDSGKYIKQRVHRLVVSQYFNIPLTDLPAVNHKDGNRTNNDVSNLEPCTRKENAQLPRHTSKVRELPKGIHRWSLGKKQYRVSLKNRGKYVTAYFFTVDEALEFYQEKFQEIHGAKPFEKNSYSVASLGGSHA